MVSFKNLEIIFNNRDIFEQFNNTRESFKKRLDNAEAMLYYKNQRKALAKMIENNK